MWPAEFLRTAPARLTLAFAGAFCGLILVVFAFLYWQTALVETARLRGNLAREAEAALSEPMPQLLREIDLRVTSDLHSIGYAALYDRTGARIAGDLPAVPRGLPVDGRPHRIEVRTPAQEGASTLAIMVAARRADGSLLVLGRDLGQLITLQRVVLRALALGVPPMIGLALLLGGLLSWRALQRVQTMHETIERMMRGKLDERLPTHGTGDALDALAGDVNRMLDEIVVLLADLRNAGDNIAHDLRTPLSVMRARLERGLATARSQAELQAIVQRTLGDLDRAMAGITALLRIAEIEHEHRRTGFRDVDLAEIAAEAFEFYEPLAEQRRLAFTLHARAPMPIHGDGELLAEAVANLVDNAIKFTPDGGSVEIAVLAGDSGPVVRVADTGPGVPPEAREQILKRFRRLDASRSIPGNGLGLNLVTAIATLHGFRLRVGCGHPGAVFELLCTPNAP